MISSIIAAMISSFILIPIFIGIQNGRANFSIENFNLDKNFNIINLIAKIFTNSFNIAEIKNGGMPPLFCGIFINLLFITYFFNKKISKKERILTFIFILIFILSFYINGVNLLWSIGNLPAWFEYRYAFMFSFMYIIIAKKRI